MIQLIFYVFVGVALVEEFCKWIITYKISYNNREFDMLYDAILYSTFVALGFACYENLTYVYEGGIKVGIIRALLAVPGHACDGILMGCYLGLSKLNSLNNNKKAKNKYLILSLLVPIITHGIYDYCLFTERLIFIIIFFIFVVGMYIYVLLKIKKVSAITLKIKYKHNYCSICDHKVDSAFCPKCGRKNE